MSKERRKELKEMNQKSNSKDKENWLKVRDNLAIVLMIESEDNSKVQNEIMNKIFNIFEVKKIHHIRRSADKLFIIPDAELKKWNLTVANGKLVKRKVIEEESR